MSSKLSRRPTVVDRLKKLFKPTRSSTLPLPSKSSSPVSIATESQRAPTSRIYPLGNRSEGNIASKLSFTKTNASSASLGRRRRPAKGEKWYIPNETTIFPLPAPSHSALRSQPVSPITPTLGRERRPSLSTSVSSHGTSDLHTPNSTIETRPPQSWIPNSGTISPEYNAKFPIVCRDGKYFNPYDDREAQGEGPERGSAIGHGGEDADTKLEKVSDLGLRSLGWIGNEVEAIQDEEMRRLASVAFCM